jgi:uncharacterized protein
MLLFGTPSVSALDVPPCKGRVNDSAGILSPHTRNYLNGALAELERTDSTQVKVLTIISLKGEPLESYSLRVAEKWGIGEKGLDNGVLLLIVQKERKIRIEVGYGLEESLTDLRAGRIIRHVIAPQFKMGRFDRGVMDGVNAIIDTVQGEYQAWDESNESPREPFLIPLGVLGLIAFLILLFVMLKDNFFSPAAAGGILVPGAATFFYDLSMLHTLYLIPVGIIAGLCVAFIRRLFKSKNRHAEYRIEWDTGGGNDESSGSGFNISFGGSSGGGSSGGGSSGGGGGFGGGGASGGW